MVVFEVKKLQDDCNDIIDLFYEGYDKPQMKIADYFKFDVDYLYEVGKENGAAIIKKILKNEYVKNEKIMKQKMAEFVKDWLLIENEIIDILNNIFQINIDKKIIARFSINVVSPRYLDTNTFDINYRKDTNQMVLTCVHELIHFYWFKKFEQLFPTIDKKEYNAKHIPWLLSEIVIDTIIKETDLRKFCEYEKVAYNYLYNISIGGENMLEHYRKMFKQESIENFMIKGLKYLQNNYCVIENY